VSASRTVGVHPATELERRPRLFAALSEAFPSVRFQGRGAGELGGLDALVEIGGREVAGEATSAGTPALALLGPESPEGAPAEVCLGKDGSLDNRLRGQTLVDRHLGEADPLPSPEGGTTVLAERQGGPLWTRDGLLDVATLVPDELDDGEPLRMRLYAERCLALLPLLELLRGLAGDEAWEPPPLRAAFLLDDPNLHWPNYGYLKLRELADHGDRHGYHLALAMVPLDAWFAHPRAAALLRERASLSLLVHGNDHLAEELGRADNGTALPLAAQAQRRIDAFQQRSGVPVSRVMAPPHEACSAAIADALPQTGFEAITMTRPFPWMTDSPDQWLVETPQTGRLAGWRVADVTPEGLPVMLRHPLTGDGFAPGELALRAYLDQPLILYGHQEDLAGGLDLLAERSVDVAALGPALWGSLADLSATNFERRREGGLLRVRPYGRRFEIDVPDGVTELVVERPPGSQADDAVATPRGNTPLGEPFAVAAGETAELRLVSPDAVSPASIPAPPRRAWPVARRIAAEARDRAAPLRRRVSLGR
jgi:hypothetical protein